MAENASQPREFEPTDTDRGKLFIVQENGGGRADLWRRRSPRQRAWLQRAVDAGWLNDEGWITQAGRVLAAEYVEAR